MFGYIGYVLVGVFLFSMGGIVYWATKDNYESVPYNKDQDDNDVFSL